jgi:hypothetical protein
MALILLNCKGYTKLVFYIKKEMDIYTDHSCERSLIGSSLMLTTSFSFSQHFIANPYYLSYGADSQ